MALITCIECNAQVSDQAKACPHCGTTKFKPEKPKAKTNLPKLIGISIVTLIAIAVVTSIVQGIQARSEAESAALAEAAKTPEQRAKDAKARAEQQANAAKAEAEEKAQLTLTSYAAGRLRTAAKDPTSFVLTAAYAGQNGSGCLEYRAKNSFGAILPASAVVLKDRTILTEEHNGNRFVSAWNKSCTKGGRDFKVVVDMVLRRE